jgi:chromosome segregation ATPase|tara:strand:+ start:780 stop:1124 length:345 start_codon:yes stop_codon:yes gene_type:complete
MILKINYMENYEEKEKKLDNVLEQLNSMSSKVAKMSKDMFLLGAEKNQLLREKEESETNFKLLNKQHADLKLELEKINKDIGFKFGNRNNFNQKIDELNQETETLIGEIEKWQT